VCVCVCVFRQIGKQVPRADVVVRRHSEGVAAGGEQSRQLAVFQAPEVTFSENTVLLPLPRRQHMHS